MNLIERLTAEEIAALAGERDDARGRAVSEAAITLGSDLAERRNAKPTLSGRPSSTAPREIESQRSRSVAASPLRAPLDRDFAKLMRGACERLSRQVTTAWSQLARMTVDVRLLDMTPLDYRTFAFAIDSPSSLAALRTDQFESTLALELPPRVLFPLLAGLLGAPAGVNTEAESHRTPTELERRLAGRYVRSWAQELRQAWRDLGPLDAHFERWELQPQRAWLAPPSDEFLVARYRVAVADESGEIGFAIPRRLLDSLWELRNRVPAARPRATHSPATPLATGDGVEGDELFEVCLADTSLSFADLCSMQVGDIVATDHAIDAPLLVRHRGEIVGSGEPGIVHGRRAIRCS